MSTVLWCELEEAGDESPDLSALYRYLDSLDQLCEHAGVRPLSALIDNSDLEYNVSDEDFDDAWLQANAIWHEPMELRVTLECVREALQIRGQKLGLRSEDIAVVVNEIDQVLDGCERARQRSVRIRLLAVM